MGNSNIQPKWYEQYVKKYKLVQNYMMDTVLDYTKKPYHIIRYIAEGPKFIWYNLDNFTDQNV